MDIDWTVVAFEVLNFGILVVLMRQFLFRPVQRALQERREAIEKARLDLEQREQAASDLRAQYEQRLTQIEAQARERLEAAVAQGRDEAETLVRQGQQEARHLVASAEQQTAVARQRALEQLRLEVIALASEAAARVVRHMGTPTVACAYARRAAHGLAELFSGDEPLGPVAAATGEDADPDQIRRELVAVLGPAARIELTIDPHIVAGVRLRAHGHEVEASASASLHAWYQQQLGHANPEAA